MNDFVRNILQYKFLRLLLHLVVRYTPMHTNMRRYYATYGAAGAEISLLLTKYCIK